MSTPVDQKVKTIMDRSDKDISEVLEDMTNDHKIRQAVNSEGDSKIGMITGSGDCAYGCAKIGIPILPVVFSRIEYKLNSKDFRYFNHSLANRSNEYNALASLPTNVYLYVFDDEHMKEYYTGNDGSIKEVTFYSAYRIDEEDFGSQSDEVSEEADENGSQPYNCTKAQHSTVASKYICLDKDSGKDYYLKVSHVKLSKNIIKKYMQNEDFRKKGMQKFAIDSEVNNPNTTYMTDSEVNYIKSFHCRKALAQGKDLGDKLSIIEQSSSTKRKGTLKGINNQPLTDSKLSVHLEHVKISTTKAINSQQAAKLLYDRMVASIDGHNELEKQQNYYFKNDFTNTIEAKPMMVALPDPIGEVFAAAEKRNYLLKKLDDKFNSN